MLETVALKKTFRLPDGRVSNALANVSLTIEKGQFFTLLGPSGCGKTTTLRSVAGLETPDTGRIAITGKPVFDSAQQLNVPANKRRLGMVFQSYAVWPHMDVFENIAFPLRVGEKGVSEADIARRVRRVLATVRMEEFERHPATRLSGGQQQRLAMARALVMEPSVLLLDEPLSNLDALLRETMRIELRRLQRELGITTIYVTHDQTEALAMSDVIAVMQNGAIVQQGDPTSIYDRPNNLFVAGFIGTTNLLAGRAKASVPPGSSGAVDFEGATLTCVMPAGCAEGAPVSVSVRPETIAIGPPAEGGPQAGPGINRLTGDITEKMFLGSVTETLVRVGSAELRIWGKQDTSLAAGTRVRLEFDERACVGLPSG